MENVSLYGDLPSRHSCDAAYSDNVTAVWPIDKLHRPLIASVFHYTYIRRPLCEQIFNQIHIS